MSNNNNRLKNAVLHNWLKGNTNVYLLMSPNHRTSHRVNKNTLFEIVKSNRVPTLRALNHLISRISLNGKPANRYSETAGRAPVRRMPNVLYASRNLPRSVRNRTKNLNNYVFNKYGGNLGRVPVRNPLYGVKNLKLKNIRKNTLSNNNKTKIKTKKENENKRNAAQREVVTRRVRENTQRRREQRSSQRRHARENALPYMFFHRNSRRLWTPNGRQVNRFNINAMNFFINVGPHRYAMLDPNNTINNARIERNRQAIIHRHGLANLNVAIYSPQTNSNSNSRS